MISYDDITKENIKQYNPNWPIILNHPCRILEKQTHYLI